MNGLMVNTNENSTTGDTSTNLPSPPPPLLTPFGKTIDLTTDSGRKCYLDATKELSVKCDEVKVKYPTERKTLAMHAGLVRKAYKMINGCRMYAPTL